MKNWEYPSGRYQISSQGFAHTGYSFNCTFSAAITIVPAFPTHLTDQIGLIVGRGQKNARIRYDSNKRTIDVEV